MTTVRTVGPVSAVALRQARKLARSLLQRGGKTASRSSVVDGYAVRASKLGSLTSARIVDLPGRLLRVSASGFYLATQPTGVRFQFDPRGARDGLGLADPVNTAYPLVSVGTPPAGPLALFTVGRTERYDRGWLSPAVVTTSAPVPPLGGFDSGDALWLRLDITPAGAGRAVTWQISEAELATLAGGLALVRRVSEPAGWYASPVPAACGRGSDIVVCVPMAHPTALETVGLLALWLRPDGDGLPALHTHRLLTFGASEHALLTGEVARPRAIHPPTAVLRPNGTELECSVGYPVRVNRTQTGMATDNRTVVGHVQQTFTDTTLVASAALDVDVVAGADSPLLAGLGSDPARIVVPYRAGALLDTGAAAKAVRFNLVLTRPALDDDLVASSAPLDARRMEAVVDATRSYGDVLGARLTSAAVGDTVNAVQPWLSTASLYAAQHTSGGVLQPVRFDSDDRAAVLAVDAAGTRLLDIGLRPAAAALYVSCYQQEQRDETDVVTCPPGLLAVAVDPVGNTPAAALASTLSAWDWQPSVAPHPSFGAFYLNNPLATVTNGRQFA